MNTGKRTIRRNSIDKNLLATLVRLKDDLLEGLNEYGVLESNKEALHNLSIHGIVTKEQRLTVMPSGDHMQGYKDIGYSPTRGRKLFVKSKGLMESEV